MYEEKIVEISDSHTYEKNKMESKFKKDMEKALSSAQENGIITPVFKISDLKSTSLVAIDEDKT